MSTDKTEIIIKLAELICMVVALPEPTKCRGVGCMGDYDLPVENSYTDYEPEDEILYPKPDTEIDMPDITPVAGNPLVAIEPLPEATPVIQVSDLNGAFAPQDGNIQPQVVGVPEPVQVEVVHSADEVEGDIVVAKIDDWATVAATEIAKAALAEPVPPVADPLLVAPVASTDPLAPAEVSEGVTNNLDNTRDVLKVASVTEDVKPDQAQDVLLTDTSKDKNGVAESSEVLGATGLNPTEEITPGKPRRSKKLNDADDAKALVDNTTTDEVEDIATTL